MLRPSPPGSIHGSLNSVLILHELGDRADGFARIDADADFLNVRPCPLQVRLGDAAEALDQQAGTQSGFGGVELAQQRLALGFNGFEIVGVHLAGLWRMQCHRLGGSLGGGWPSNADAADERLFDDQIGQHTIRRMDAMNLSSS